MNKKDFLVSTQLGIQFALSVALFTGLGYWLDKKLGTLPVFLIILAFAGFALGTYSIVRGAKNQVDKNDKR